MKNLTYFIHCIRKTHCKCMYLTLSSISVAIVAKHFLPLELKYVYLVDECQSGGQTIIFVFYLLKISPVPQLSPRYVQEKKNSQRKVNDFVVIVISPSLAKIIRYVIVNL